MLTIFTTTKPFTGHFKIIQTNAIKSWMSLGPQVHVILMGTSMGTKEFAEKNHLKYISRVKTNRYKTPLISSLFKTAEKNSSDPFLAYVNADIILFPSFLEAIKIVFKKFPQFLIIGQRIDTDTKKLVNFKDSNQIQNLIDVAKKRGKLHPVTGIDYFLYPRNFWGEIPDFGVGRFRWDNWLVSKGTQLGTVIDATKFIKIIHQNHNYSHILQGLKGKIFKAELEINEKLARGHSKVVSDANYLLTKFGLFRNRDLYKNPQLRMVINSIPLINKLLESDFKYKRFI